MDNKLILIDGNSIAYRAFFALPLLNNDKGVYTNAVYGFTTMLLKILEEEKPSHILVAFDAGKTTFRHKTFQEYKGGRQKTPPELSEQFPILREVLDAFSIKHYELPEYEADDIIGTLAKRAEKDNWQVNIISGDKDLLQLVSDNVKVSLTRKGLSEVDTYTPSFLKEKLDIKPDQVIHMKALMGDNSDNIPGVPGVGEKTAIKLLTQFETLEKLFDNLDDVSGKKLKEKLETHKQDAFMSKELVTIQCESPIAVEMDDIAYNGYDARKVMAIFKELSFQSLLNRVSTEGEHNDLSEIRTLSQVQVDEVDTITEHMLTDLVAIELEMLGDNYHTDTIIGIGLVNNQKKYFIPTEVALHSDIFKKWAEDGSKQKFVFDAKKVRVALLKHDIRIEGIEFDLLLASYLIDPSENHHDIPAISHRFGNNDVLFDEEVYGKGAKMKVPEHDELVQHVTRKTTMIFELKEIVEQELKENSQYELFKELELPLALILGEMEAIGVEVDKGRLLSMGAELQERLKMIEAEVHELAGEPFNLNSPKQLGPILFEKLGLPVIKKTKTGYSTSADILEQLQDQHEIIPKLLLYRQLGKLQSTYIEGLLKVIHPKTNKIHTRYNQALTQTGRLSSTEPNLQNIPIRLEEGKKIRQAFIPSKENWVIFAADYSQIELRVLAHIAKDDKLIQAFKDDMDIHTRTAMEVFHVDKHDVTANMRRHAKAVNFGIVYGISDYGLSQSLGITRKEAQQFIDRYLDSYPGVKNYMDEIVHDAKQKGYVTTLMNRRRYLQDITSRNFNRRSFAERTAMNTPIQGSAADIIKLAMINLFYQLDEEKLQARMIMQVHDELIIEAPREEVDQLKELVPSVMENAIELDVPLKVDYAYGDTWFDAK
ncbi:DNA polymerase I [Aquibacillus salsiterrae]|uniref:DNA polymerase I n=1 Tax=Aquibacillus salsiterrae TaxID=2950439 RepID=A0A9X3WE28_9BACI|nr:DNA polymerase I [Aquibacillus salsiterrae]MDC3415739.1 DNA polymerase I [Aquibacillus salsiterrae]